MAKKSRRARRRQVRLSPAQMVRPTVDEAPVPPSAVVPLRPLPAGMVSATDDLREEYRYVIADLKRIGVLAVIMLVVLIALALLLT